MTMLRQARIGRAIRVTEIVAGNERPHVENRPVPSEVFPRRGASCPIIAIRPLWVCPAVFVLGR